MGVVEMLCFIPVGKPTSSLSGLVASLLLFINLAITTGDVSDGFIRALSLNFILITAPVNRVSKNNRIRSDKMADKNNGPGTKESG